MRKIYTLGSNKKTAEEFFTLLMDNNIDIVVNIKGTRLKFRTSLELFSPVALENREAVFLRQPLSKLNC